MRRKAKTRSKDAPLSADIHLLGDLLGEVIDEAAGDLPEPQRRALDVALLRAGDGAMRPDRRPE